MNFLAKLTAVLGFALISSPLAAATIHDESTDGDLGDSAAPTALGVLAGGRNTVLFSFSGLADEDVLTFTVTGLTQIGITHPAPILLDLTPGGNEGISFGRTERIFADLAPGDYSLALTPFFDGQSDQFTLDIDVAAVPLPATALLLLTGLVGLGAARRRKTA